LVRKQHFDAKATKTAVPFLRAAPQSAAAMPFGRYLHERMDQEPSAWILSLRVLIYTSR
jgi:hypothetical protein